LIYGNNEGFNYKIYNIFIMKNLRVLTGSSKSEKNVVNEMMFEIMKGGKVNRDELKEKMFLVRFKSVNGFDYKDEDFEKYDLIMIKDLLVKSRNCIDTFVSKCNKVNGLIFEDVNGGKGKKFCFENGMFLVK